MSAEFGRPSAVVLLFAALHLVAAGLLVACPSWWGGLLLALAVAHAAMAALVMWPQNQALGPALVRLPAASAARGEVTLTFDDGPDPDITPQVLALLAAAGVTASFFCIAARARRYPALLQAIVRAGHSVENHTMNHPAGFAFLAPAGLRREVCGAQAILAGIAGQTPRFFRAPMGFRPPLLAPLLAASGLAAACWTRRGYDTRARRPATVLRALLHNLAPGDVLLLHDGNAGRGPDGVPLVLAVLPGLLAALQARGLKGVCLRAACAAPAAAPARPPPAPAWYAST